jgi:transcriptional regulator with XRE-family HTH domain
MTYTMRDVARLAGVSIATVSAVLTGKKPVSTDLRGRIEEAMRALDYHPDHVARSLKMGSTNVVGMVIPDVTNPFFTELMQGAEEEARRCGMSVMLSNTDGDPVIEHHQLNTLLAHRVDGILLSCADSFTPWERLERRKVPLVFFDRLPVGYQGAAVALDNRAAASEATRYLIGIGHRRIAIIAVRSLWGLFHRRWLPVGDRTDCTAFSSDGDFFLQQQNDAGTDAGDGRTKGGLSGSHQRYRIRRFRVEREFQPAPDDDGTAHASHGAQGHGDAARSN